MTTTLQKTSIYTVLVIALLIVLVPMAVMVSVSLQTPANINPLSLPKDPQWSNYTEAFRTGNLLPYFGNSILVLVMTTAAAIGVSVLAAYGLHHGKRYKSEAMSTFFLMGLILPAFSGTIPAFLVLREIHLLNTHIGLSLIQIASGLALPIFLYVNFFKTVPSEIEEAALVDGCGPWRTFVKIIFPLTLPITVTCIIVVAINSWNDFFNPLIYLSSPDMRTLPVGLMAFKSQYNTNWPQMFAGATLVALPIILLYLFVQRFIIKGLVGGAVKG
ncbi:carbohydrate ABC transporter permease [Paenibacillus sp. MMS20-IR301]|uniref:carbohydrate ABC transporter permease n=1 Tax=Paenibacillus sp. MMS20-IR301 TaxID=2895946 RepID=UPI0028EE211B|nr:carbohydrate ABC transporter permease [Paenibacillus sp. MMS20-IR301]WNS41145.1 carbohydrate ABC transporter permease [Paenibacillus sp. MMS20-IR301]